MSIITISRGSYSKGKEIAEKVSARLDYECLSRDVMLEASKEFNIPEIKLIRAIHDAPGILDRLSHNKSKYSAYVQMALIQHFRKDNIVYHGLAGQFFVKHIPHVLKVRILADMEERIKLEMAREGISYEKAANILKKDDMERHKWSQTLYGIDTKDSSLYDLIINTRKITVDNAVEIICCVVDLDQFKSTPESQKALDDLALASEVSALLIEHGLETEVTAKDNIVTVRLEASIKQEHLYREKIEEIAGKIDGVKEVHFDIVPS